MLNEVFKKADDIMKQLEEHGFESYFVGGAVRDFLANRPIGDIDIATNATPNEVQNVFSKTVPVGIEHGTVLVLHNGESYEVTTYRTEGEYEDYRHPNDVSFVKDIKLDLGRRDFTINAIAMDRMGRLLDPFEGQQDLMKRIIRTVHSPYERFSEDPLRMLRGVRFISQLNFDMEDNTIAAVEDLHHLLSNISIERITDELSKLFSFPHINKALNVIYDSNLHQSMPIFNQDGLFDKLVQLDFKQPLNHAGVLFGLFHLIDPDVSLQNWIKTYKVSNNIKRQASHIIECYNLYKAEGLTDWVVYKAGKHLNDLYQVISLLETTNITSSDLSYRYNQLSITSREEVAITGNDLLQWFPNEKRGKWIGQYLSDIEKLIVTRSLKNNRDEIESRVREWKEQEKS